MTKTQKPARTKQSVETQTEENLPAVREATEVAVYDYGDDAGSGFTSMSPHDLDDLPQLRVLNALSAPLNSYKADFIRDAKAGQLWDTGRNKVMDSAVIVPAYEVRLWSETDSNGYTLRKIVCERQPEGVHFDKDGYYLDGSPIEESRLLFCLLVEAGSAPSPVLLPFKNTRVRVALACPTALTTQDGF